MPTPTTSDYFLKTGNPGSATTLSAPGYTVGGSTISVGSTGNFPTDTAVIFAIDTVSTVTGAQVEATGSYCVFVGIVTSSTSIGSLSLLYGTPQNYAAGANTRVFITISTQHTNRLMSGLLVQHNQNGTHGAITATSVSAPTITSTGNVSDNGNTLTQYRDDLTFDYVVSGGVWTADSPGSTRNASMTAMVVWQAGQRLSIGSVTGHSFTASKDTYIDILNTAGVGSVVYTEVTNNAASPALAANSIRIGIVVTGASNIAATTSISQGGFANIVPVVSGTTLKGADSLGNIIYPKGPTNATKTQNSVKFSVYRNNPWTTSSTASLVTFDAVEFDTGSNYSTSTGKFTAPLAGFYNIITSVNETSGGSGITTAILYKNGSLYQYLSYNASGASNIIAAGTSVVQLAAGDYLQIYFQGGAGGGGGASLASTRFQGFLISAS